MNPPRRPPERTVHPPDTGGSHARLAGRLAAILGDAVDLLGDARLADGPGVPPGVAAGPLIEQCLELCRRRGEALKEPVRTLLQRDVLVDAGIDTRAHAVALTPNEHVNLLFAQLVAEDFRGPEIYVALERFDAGVNPTMVERSDGNILFGGEHDLLIWIDRVRRKTLRVSRWRLDKASDAATKDMPTDQLMFMVHVRDNDVSLFTQRTSLRDDDEVVAAIATDGERIATDWLGAHGWVLADAPLARDG